MRAVLLAAALLAGTPAVAQTAPTPAPTAIDPARLAAARKLIDSIFPAAQREQMMTAMVTSMMQNMLGGLQQQPDIAKLIEKEPRSRTVFERFIQRQQAKSVTLLNANIPDMMDAMGRAYARRFTIAQLAEMQRFFDTPTGQVYIAQSATIMADPDIAAWQRKLMTQSMATTAQDVRQFVQELMALAPATKAKQ